MSKKLEKRILAWVHDHFEDFCDTDGRLEFCMAHPMIVAAFEDIAKLDALDGV